MNSFSEDFAFQPKRARQYLDTSVSKSQVAIKTRKASRQKNKDLEIEEAKGSKSDIEEFISSIAALWAAKSFSYRSEVSKRLHRLRHACLEEEIELSVVSLRSFIEFIKSQVHLSYPQIALTDSGNIRASWRRSENEYIAIEFLNSSVVKFVLFTKNNNNMPTRIAGAIPVRQIASLAVQLNVDWMR